MLYLLLSIKIQPHKIKSSYKSLAAIPTNTLLLDQQVRLRLCCKVKGMHCSCSLKHVQSKQIVSKPPPNTTTHLLLLY